MADILKTYVTARAELQQEKTALEARLQEINRVLNGSQIPLVLKRRGRPPKLSKVKAVPVPAIATAKPKKKRKMSAAARARIAAAAKARWAKRKAEGKNKL